MLSEGREMLSFGGWWLATFLHMPQPMMLNFPFPAWATRRKEMVLTVKDDEALNALG